MGNRNSCNNDRPSRPKVEIPKGVEVVDLQKKNFDYSKKNIGQGVYWAKICTARLRDLIEKYKENKYQDQKEESSIVTNYEFIDNKIAARYLNKTRSGNYYNIDYLLKQVPIGTNYEWIDHKITTRYSTDEFYTSYNSIATHIEISNIGQDDYILLGADASVIVNSLSLSQK
jgi:hypothetical protein